MMNTLTRMTLLLSPAFMMIGGCRNDKAMNASLNAIRTSVSVEFGSYDGSHNTGMKVIDFREAGKAGLIHTDWDADWDVHTGIKKLPGTEKYYLVDIQAVSLSDNPAYQAVGFRLDFHDWSTNNYVLFPAAAYNGNRYKGQPKKRHQGICDATDCGPYMKPFLTDVPRLNISDGPSAIQLISGDMSTPSAGIRFNDLNKGIILLTGQGTDIGDYSYKIEESADRSTAFMTIRMPGIREDSCFMGRRGYPSPDRGRRFAKGDTVHMQFRLLFFDAPAIQSIFDHFINIRKDIGNQHLTERLPYSSAWKLQQKKYNTQNWVAKHGYYSVGMRENPYQDWQTGWTGGMNAVYPLLFNGNDTTRGRVLQTFPFLYDTITPSGFFFGVYYQDSWYDPDHEAFLRRNSDALYFIMKSYSLIKDLYPGRTIPEDWEEAARGAANSYVALFEEYGQFGQWIDNQTGDIIAGTTASNGIACGALALCSQHYEDRKYLDVAVKATDYYYEHFTRKGLTNGGPGDVWQCPDSESAFGLLESYVTLYEVTGDKKYLGYAEDMAKQCASWVVSYNFRFPEQSTFAKMGMETTGTVIANVNNKHSAPGICTLSGNSLLRLYRYTRDERYLDLISDIARTIPQYMSRADRPIPDIRPGQPVPVMPPGWINERVNMSDWEERGNPGDIRRGEIFGGSTWAEVACMLTYTEIPGLYIIPDQGKVTVMDAVEAVVKQNTDSELVIEVVNPTKFEADVRTLVENSGSMKDELPGNYLLHSTVIHIKPTAKVVCRISKEDGSVEVE